MIATTVYTRMSNEDNFLKVQIDDFLEKQLDMELLVNTYEVFDFMT